MATAAANAEAAFHQQQQGASGLQATVGQVAAEAQEELAAHPGQAHARAAKPELVMAGAAPRPTAALVPQAQGPLAEPLPSICQSAGAQRPCPG